MTPLTADPPAAVSLDSLRAAARVLEGVAVRTPLLDLPDLGARLGVPVALKCELLQPIGAFKIRGAYNAVARVAGRRSARGRGDPVERQPRPGRGVRRAPLRAPGGRGHAGIHPGREDRRRAAPRRRGRARRRHPLAGARGARRSHRPGRGPGDDPPVQPPGRHRGPGHVRARDPGAAPRRADDPGADRRRRAHRGYLGGGGRAGPGRPARGRRAGRRRQAHRAPSPPERRGRSIRPRAWPTGCCPARSAT